MSKKKREPVDPEHLKPEDRMKFEIAKELGLADKVIAGGYGKIRSWKGINYEYIAYLFYERRI